MSLVYCHFFPVSVWFDIKCNCHNNKFRASFVAFKTSFLQRLQELKRSSVDKNNRTHPQSIAELFQTEAWKQAQRICEAKMRQGGSVTLFTQYINIDLI